jgi:hypothetical protein
VKRLGDYRFPKCILGYTSMGRRDVRRPRKRWKDRWARRGLKACVLKLLMMMMMMDDKQ